jgi:hypothetical protein
VVTTIQSLQRTATVGAGNDVRSMVAEEQGAL